MHVEYPRQIIEINKRIAACYYDLSVIQNIPDKKESDIRRQIESLDNIEALLKEKTDWELNAISEWRKSHIEELKQLKHEDPF